MKMCVGELAHCSHQGHCAVAFSGVVHRGVDSTEFNLLPEEDVDIF